MSLKRLSKNLDLGAYRVALGSKSYASNLQESSQFLSKKDLSIIDLNLKAKELSSMFSDELEKVHVFGKGMDIKKSQ